jgi:signal transduction histidine kinase
MYVKTSGKPVFDVNGEFRGYRGTGTDVTAIMRAQEENERLRQLESDLAHMNRLSMMGEFAASLAHEITQPIATARNNARAAIIFLDKPPPNLGRVREALACVVSTLIELGKSLTECLTTSRKRRHEGTNLISMRRSARYFCWCTVKSRRIECPWRPALRKGWLASTAIAFNCNKWS